MAELDIESEIDRLYALPLSDFIGERNALAKRLRAAGDRQAADQVKALAKPPVTAWAVNALYHRERRRFDELLEAAAAVRAALGGEGDRRQAEAARRKALRELLGRAAELLAEAGHAATPASRQRVSHTLETLAARDPEAEGPRPGRLTADLEPQGFDVLAGLAASLPPPTPISKAVKAPGRGPATRSAAASRAAGKATAKTKPAGKTPTPAKTARKGRATAAKGGKSDQERKRDERLAAARREVERGEEELAGLEREAEAAGSAAAAAVERHEQLTVEAVDAERLARAAAKAAAEAKTRMAEAKAAASESKTARRRALAKLASARKRLERLEG